MPRKYKYYIIKARTLGNNGGSFPLPNKRGDFMDYITGIILIAFMVALTELIKNIKKK